MANRMRYSSSINLSVDLTGQPGFRLRGSSIRCSLRRIIVDGNQFGTHLPPPIFSSGARRVSVAYLALGVVAQASAGYNIGLAMVHDRPDRLVVIGSSSVEVEHPDRSRPLEVTFRLHNPTRQSIQIGEILSNCRCVVAGLSGRTVAPGAEVALTVRVTSFGTYQERFAERIVVESSLGPLELMVSGRIPLRPEALAFPTALFIERDSQSGWPARTIRVRVPVGCAREPDQFVLTPTGLDLSSSSVEEVQSAGSYREFLVRIEMSPIGTKAGPAEGRLRLEGGCEPITIPVTFSHR